MFDMICLRKRGGEQMKSKRNVVVTKESLIVYCALARYYNVGVELLLNALLESKMKMQKLVISKEFNTIH